MLEFVCYAHSEWAHIDKQSYRHAAGSNLVAVPLSGGHNQTSNLLNDRPAQCLLIEKLLSVYRCIYMLTYIQQIVLFGNAATKKLKLVSLVVTLCFFFFFLHIYCILFYFQPICCYSDNRYKQPLYLFFHFLCKSD